MTYIFRQGGKGYKLGNEAGSAEILGVGSSSNRVKSADANVKFFEFRVESSATSGDNRAIYNRLYITGAGNGGESLRSFTTVEDVAASTAHGAHISLNFGDSGTVTGQGIASRNTLHIPNIALTSNVTMSAVQAEIYSDGATSDPGGSTILSYFRAVNAGNATGGADVDDDAVLFDIQGHTIGTGNMVAESTTEANYSHSIKVRIDSTEYYLMLASAEG